MNYLEIENLSVTLSGRPVVRGVSLELRRGEMIGLIGPNGAGKTTLIKAILRLVESASGTIRVMGRPVRSWKRKELARELSYMAQGQAVHWPISVWRAVALGRTPHGIPWRRHGVSDAGAVERAMQETEIAHLAGRAVTELAGGEKTLVMLARCLAGEPSVLMADEPVAGLDPGHQIEVMNLLRGLTLAGKSVIVVLHDLTLAARYCSRLYLLKDGRILASGAPDAVLNPANLEQAYGVKARYGHFENEFYVVPWARLK